MQGLHDYQEKFLKDAGVGFKVQTEEFVSDEYLEQYEYRHPALVSSGEADMINSCMPASADYFGRYLCSRV